MINAKLQAVIVAAGLATGMGTALGQEAFSELEIGSITYTNAKVANRNTTDIYIRHDGGFANLKVADLPPDVLALLGYETTTPEPSAASTLIARLREDPRILALQDRFTKTLESSVLQMDQTKVAALVVACFVLYLFFCYCSFLVCRNAGKEPGLLVWIPVLQTFPMLRAAGMSPWWILLNIVAAVVWSLKIAKACGKSVIVGVLLLLPGVNLFAFLYLAFSGGRMATDAEPIRLNLREG